MEFWYHCQRGHVWNATHYENFVDALFRWGRILLPRCPSGVGDFLVTFSGFGYPCLVRTNSVRTFLPSASCWVFLLLLRFCLVPFARTNDDSLDTNAFISLALTWSSWQKKSSSPNGNRINFGSALCLRFYPIDQFEGLFLCVVGRCDDLESGRICRTTQAVNRICWNTLDTAARMPVSVGGLLLALQTKSSTVPAASILAKTPRVGKGSHQSLGHHLFSVEDLILAEHRPPWLFSKIWLNPWF